MLNTPSIKKLSSPTSLSNVGSRGGDVERTGPMASGVCRVWVLIALGVALWGVALVATGCVESAECNATVRCPDEEVCYDYECRAACASAEECATSEQCVPCVPDGLSGDGDHCFGTELNACVPEDS